MSNKLPKTKKTEQRTCVFCKGTPLTKEHIFPDWLKSILDRESELKHSSDRLSVQFEHGKAFLTPFRKQKSGNLMSTKLLIVCKSCNSGWMSMLQQQTKPILTPLVLGESIILKTAEIDQRLKWIVMATMVAEFDDREYKRIPISQLRAFKLDPKIPEGWKIWIGAYEGTKPAHYNHIGSTQLSRNFRVTHLQASTFIIGKFIIYAVSSDDETTIKNYSNQITDKLVQIYPHKSSFFFTSSPTIQLPIMPINDEDFDRLITLETFKQSSNSDYPRPY